MEDESFFDTPAASDTPEKKFDPVIFTIYAKPKDKDRKEVIWWIDVRLGKYGLYASQNKDGKNRKLDWNKLKEKLDSKTWFLNVNQRVRVEIYPDQPKEKVERQKVDKAVTADDLDLADSNDDFGADEDVF